MIVLAGYADDFWCSTVRTCSTNLYYSSGGSTATITGGKWQHVAWVGNASHVNIYLNGNSVFVNSLGATPSNFYPSSFYTR